MEMGRIRYKLVDFKATGREPLCFIPLDKVRWFNMDNREEVLKRFGNTGIEEIADYFAERRAGFVGDDNLVITPLNIIYSAESSYVSKLDLKIDRLVNLSVDKYIVMGKPRFFDLVINMINV